MNKIKKYIYEITIFVIIAVYVCVVILINDIDNSVKFNFSYAIDLLPALLPIIISVLIQMSNKKIQSDNIKTKGCPKIIFNRVQEFESIDDKQGNPVKNKCRFKARFFDKNDFLLKHGKITKITLYKSYDSEHEEYDSGTVVYNDNKREYCDLEFTPKSDNKIDKELEDKEDFYYLITEMNYDFNDIYEFEGFIKLSIEMSVLTIFGLETKMVCNLIFKRDRDSIYIKERREGEYVQKEISHRFINYISIDYIGELL